MIGVAIKVKIGLKPNGHADYPDWTTLPLAGRGTDEERENAVRTHQIIKWRYDNSSGHDDETPDSPRGMQWGLMVVSEQFAAEAIQKWPDRVFVITEAEARDFWDNRVYGNIPEIKHDSDALQGLLAERQLREATGADLTDVDNRIARAINPDDPMPGMRRQRENKWVNVKMDKGLIIKS